MANKQNEVMETEDQYGGDDCIEAGQLAPIEGTAADEALKQLQAWRDNGDVAADDIVAHFTELTHSPAFKAFLVRAKAPPTVLPDPNWNLAWFGAEMLTVGILMGLRQFGRRTAVTTDIRFDSHQIIETLDRACARIRGS